MRRIEKNGSSRRRSRTLGAAAFAWTLILAGLAVAEPEAPRWRTDFPAALREAREARKPLLVVLHKIGCRGSESMVRPYAHRRFARATAGVIPVVVCYFDEAGGGVAKARFGARSAAQLVRARNHAHRHLFGPGTTIPVPQHVILHPDGGVAWHRVYQCSLSQLLGGLTTARREIAKTPKSRLLSAKSRASSLLRRARRDNDSFLLLRTLVALSPEDHFPALVGVIRKVEEVCRWVLADLAETLPPALAEQRLLVAAPIVGRRIVDDLLAVARSRLAPVACPEGATVASPLTSLGRVQGVAGAGLPSPVQAALRGETARITVLWFFRTEDQSLERQTESLRETVRELRKSGVRFQGLACSLDPAKDQEAAQKAGLPFPCVPYRYHGETSLAGVSWFPSAVVLDRDGNVVFRSGQDADGMRAGYTAFASIARRLVALEVGARSR